MGRRYGKPPLVEALCEFRFAPNSSWDLTIPGLIYEKVRDPFSERRQAHVIEAVMAGSPGGLEQRTTTSERMQFFRPDQKALIQVGKHLLVVNHLQPYPGWDCFLPLIEQGFQAYQETTGAESITRIGLRYINRFEIAERSLHLEDYFVLRPCGPETLIHNMDSFIVGIELPSQSGQDMLRIQLASGQPGAPNTTTIMLDLDYYTCESTQVAPGDVRVWLDAAHGQIEQTFEACVEDRLRDTFDEIEPASNEV